MTITMTWNGTSSATIPELTIQKITRRLLGAERGKFVEIPGKEGAWYLPGPRGMREITIDAFIMSEDGPSMQGSRRDAITALADFLDVGQMAKLTLSDAPGVYYNAVFMDPPDVDEWRELGIMTLTFHAEPYSYDINVTEETFSVTGTSGGLTMDFGLIAPTYPIIEVINTAGAGATVVGLEVVTNGRRLRWGSETAWTYRGNAPDIEEDDVPLLSPRGAALVDFNGYGQGSAIYVDGLVYDGLGFQPYLDEDDVLTFNAISGVVTSVPNDDLLLTGAYDPTDLTMEAIYGEFPILIPGSNTISVEILLGDSQALEVSVRYRKRYRN